jgi:uncharacterized membrane protein YgcG
LLAAASPARAQDERVLDFHSDITVNPDATLTVREAIRVRTAGREIKHGIYRDIPIDYGGGLWFPKVAVDLNVQEILCDGRPETYTVGRSGNDQRIRIGREGADLAPGEHVYTIAYRIDRMLGFFKDHDELYWNVTGNNWTFPIDHVSAAVTVPAGVRRDDVKCEAFTGAKGDKGKNYRTSMEGTQAVFETLTGMPTGHGLTIVVSWPKGFVTPPTRDQEVRWLLKDNLTAAIGLMGVIAVFLYYVVAWLLVGRDPPKGTIIPLFEPPEGLSAAAVRYILRMGYDTKCMAAAVIDMAVRGHARIEEHKSGYRLVKMSTAKATPLPAEESAVQEALVGDAAGIDFDNTHYQKFQNATKFLKKSLTDQFKRRYFFSHLEFALAGTALSLLVLAVLVLSVPLDQAFAAVMLTVMLSFWSIGVYALMRQVIQQWRGVLAGKDSKLEEAFTTGGAIFYTLFGLPFFAVEVFILGVLGWMVSVWFIPIALALLVLNILFYHLLKAPTSDGRHVMDEIEGFRMYLATAEGDRLNSLQEPERTPELFERYLPYALALGVENRWAQRFADILARSGTPDGGGSTSAAYSPGWYHGTSFGTLGAAAFGAALGLSLSSAFSSASSAPGSSSGSSSGGGGGGSSGGGGGGGGGGGW